MLAVPKADDLRNVPAESWLFQVWLRGALW